MKSLVRTPCFWFFFSSSQLFDLCALIGTAVATAAIKALTGVIQRCVATTMMGLQKELDIAAQELRAVDPTISLISGTELFLRFVSPFQSRSILFFFFFFFFLFFFLFVNR